MYCTINISAALHNSCDVMHNSRDVMHNSRDIVHNSGVFLVQNW